MDDNQGEASSSMETVNTSQFETKLSPKNRLPITPFILFALGVVSITIYSFFSTHDPGWLFGIYTPKGLFFYYTITNALPPLGFTLIVLAAAILIPKLIRNLSAVRIQSSWSKPTNENIEALRQRANKEPNKIEPIWDLGQAYLRQYFNRNLDQISNIYNLSVGVMLLGFLLIVIAVFGGFFANAITPALIGSLAGIVTEFIGATFLFIYRSTMKQASDYMKTVERITTVGIATKILDTITDDSRQLNDETKAGIAKLLLAPNLEQKEETRKRGSTKKEEPLEV